MLQPIVRLYQHAYQGLSPSVWLLAGVRFGFYYVQLVSLLFGGAFLLGLQLVTGFYALCGSVFIFTLLGDSFRPANQSAIAFYSDSGTRTRAFSLNRLAINLGWAVGGGLGGWLAGINYSLLFWADSLKCLAAGLVLWRYLPVPTTNVLPNSSGLPGQQVPSESGRTSPYRDPLFMAFVVCSALYLTVFMQLFSIVPLYFKQVLRMSEGRIGVLMALNGVLVVGIEMALVYRLEQQKRAKTSLIAIGVLLTAVSYVVLAATASVSALVFILIITVSEMLTIPFIQSFTVGRSSPATRGQYLALYAMGGALAQTVAPAFGSQMVTHFGYSVHWLVVAGMSLLSAGGFWWVGRVLSRKDRATLQHIPTSVADLGSYH